MVPDVPADPKLAEILRRFSGLLVDALARFDDLVSIKAPPPGAALPQDVDYVFEMSAQSVEGATEGFGRLRSVQDGRIVWTASSARPLAGGVEDPELAEIARRLAVRLAEPFGIIHADFRQFSAHPAMRCILQALDVSRTMTAEDHLAARTCIDGAGRAGPRLLSCLGPSRLPDPERTRHRASIPCRGLPSTARSAPR